MSIVNRAIWYIESHHAEDITLENIAETVGVSRYHLTRAFAVATGYSVIRYLRARRLSIAAQALANGDIANILEVALEAGYNSHEAFTRAFRDQFGITPEMIRQQKSLHHLNLVEPILMSENSNQTIESPRIEIHKSFLVAGLREKYGVEASQHIPAQWQRFAPYIGSIPSQIGNSTYGVGYNGDDEGNINYITGIEVENFSNLPDDLDYVRIPEQKYAVFQHRDHVSTIGETWDAIWSQYLPQSDLEVTDAPFFEHYGNSFNPVTGLGGIELWVPVK